MAPINGYLDTYWRLCDYNDTKVKVLQERLKDAGYRGTSGMLKPALVERARRTDLGLLCYDACYSGELSKFVRDRGIDMKKDSSRLGLIPWLTYTDETPEFHRFTNLPPELRIRIYSFYVAAFPQTLLTPTQPPLTQTCKLIRNESLPVFYGQCTFVLNFIRSRHATSATNPLPVFRPTQDTTCFLETLTRESAAEIRSVQVCIGSKTTVRPEVGIVSFCDCTLHLDNSGIGCSFSIRGSLDTEDDSEVQARAIALEGKLQEVMNSIDFKGGKLVFKVEDFYAFRRALAAVFI